MVSRTFLIVFIVLCLAACAVAPEAPETPETPEEVFDPAEEAPERTPAAVAPPKTDPGLRTASASLLDQAHVARMNGELDKADALLLRAQRLDPGNALVYLELAHLYLQRGQERSARAVAERGLLYCDATSCDELKAIARP
jgi:Tfp pilus assembly protein PilF